MLAIAAVALLRDIREGRVRQVLLAAIVRLSEDR